jgi:hypothetical protein
MAVPPQLLPTLRDAIAANPVLNALPQTSDNAFFVAAYYNQPASPTFWVWKTSLSKKEIVETTTADGTTFSYTVHIGRSQGERDTWFGVVPDPMNPSLPNLRQGLDDIYSGATQQAAAQRLHWRTCARRPALAGEKLFVDVGQGSGTTASPATLTFQGPITPQDVENAWAQP